MDNPCKQCLVSACCSIRCEEYAKYIFDSKEYKEAGSCVSKHIDEMSYEDAIRHILKVEIIAQYMNNVYKKVL